MSALFEVDGLTRDFGGVRAVSELSFSLSRGRMLAIVGPNGCGKTTLFNLISGALRPSAGSVRFKGMDITGKAPQTIAALGVKRKFQVPSVFEEMTVRGNLALASLGGEAPGGPFNLLRKSNSTSEIRRLLRLSTLQEKAESQAGGLSHGERQRLEIAMALAGHAELLLLDEPTAGMTLVESQAVARLLASLVLEGGPAILVIEHDMKVVEALSCPVAVMVDGRFIMVDDYAVVSRDPAVRDAYIGRSQDAGNSDGDDHGGHDAQD